MRVLDRPVPMNVTTSYGDILYKSGDITKTIRYQFDNLKDLLDFRETMEAEHIVLFSSLTIKVEKYVDFERWMVEDPYVLSHKEGGEEE